MIDVNKAKELENTHACFLSTTELGALIEFRIMETNGLEFMSTEGLIRLSALMMREVANRTL